MTDDAIVSKGDRAYAGQASYNRVSLNLYDPIARWITFPRMWHCPRSRMLEFYNEHISGRHLDVGVGSGYFPDNCQFPVEKPEITLMDLNGSSLTHTAQRLERFAPVTHQANALEPWQLSNAPFDSVSMMNVLHCLPGSMPEKTPAFAYARSVLAPGGEFFGVTVLGEGVEKTLLSRLGLRLCNRFVGFGNLHDNPQDLEAGLADAFDSYEVELQGLVALFVGRVKA